MTQKTKKCCVKLRERQSNPNEREMSMDIVLSVILSCFLALMCLWLVVLIMLRECRERVRRENDFAGFPCQLLLAKMMGENGRSYNEIIIREKIARGLCPALTLPRQKLECESSLLAATGSSSYNHVNDRKKGGYPSC